MVAITYGKTQTQTASAPNSSTAPTAAKTTPSGSGVAAPKGLPADIVELSDHAKAIVEKAKADQAAAADLALSFDERLAKRTDALTETLTKAFAGLNVNLDEAVRLQVDKFGKVTTEGPWKKKIEKFFEDNPELAKELKEISALNALKAASTALDLYTKEKGSTVGSKQQQEAWATYNIRSMNIQTLSGVMSLKDGKLRSAAVDYIDMFANPHGDGTAASQRDIATRLA